MLDVAWGDHDVSGDEPEGSEASLPPLPKRVYDTDGPGGPDLGMHPEAYVFELLERARVLLHTLDHDVAGLHEDVEEEKLRIESEQKRLRDAAAKARADTDKLIAEATKIAVSKDKVPLLEQGLHGVSPVDTTVDFGTVRDELVTELRAARGITGAIRLGRIGELLRQAEGVVARMDDDAENFKNRRYDEAAQELAAERKEAEASFEIGTSILQRDLGLLEEALPASARSWDHESWVGWEPPSEQTGVIRLGTYHHDDLPAEVPVLVPFPTDQAIVIDTLHRPVETLRGVQSLLIRMLTAFPPGGVRFSFIDPKGLGEGVAPLLPLAEFDAGLIDDGVAKSPEEIELRLAELTDHIESVIQHHLRGAYASLAEANAAAGEQVEPYRVLVMLDYPTQLSANAAELLQAIVEHGPRCGVQTLITKAGQPTFGGPKPLDTSGAFVLDADRDGFFLEAPQSGRWTVVLDRPPGEMTERLVRTVGGHATSQPASALGLRRLYDLMGRAVANGGGPAQGLPALAAPVDPEDPATWWSGSSAGGVAAPLGRAGGAAVAGLALDGRNRPGLLVLGGRGSGPASLVQSMVTGLAVLYPPSEIELHLVGLRGSRAFDVFAEQRLPHARVVATNADRELALSVLTQLSREVERRLDLLRDSVGERAGYEALRASDASEGRPPLPRLVAVVDGYGTLFAQRDRLAERADAALDELVRLGPAAGVHVVLAGTTDEPGVAAPGSLAALQPRLVLPMANDHAERILGEAVAAEVAAIRRRGEAVLLPNADGVDGAKRVQLIEATPTEQALTLRDLRRLADAKGQLDGPQHLDGDAVARLERRNPAVLIGDRHAAPARLLPRLWLGEPVGVGAPVEVLLRRQAGANMLAVMDDPELGQGALVSSATTAMLVHGPHVAVLVLDLMPLDGGMADAVRSLGDAGWTLQVTRRRDTVAAVRTIQEVVRQRQQGDDARAKPVLFMVNGVQRMPEDTDLAALEAVLRDGPEVGVHTLLWADSMAAAEAKLPAGALRHIRLRVAGPMSPAESSVFVDSEKGDQLRPNEALLCDDEQGKLVRFLPYRIPADEWLAELAATHGVTSGTDASA